jgi:hypothetical protein
MNIISFSILLLLFATVRHLQFAAMLFITIMLLLHVILMLF